MDELKDWDATLNDGLEDLPWEETSTESVDWAADLPEEVMDEILMGEVFIVEDEPSIEEQQSIESVESLDTDAGLVGIRPERRRVKNAVRTTDDSAPIKKGPLWNFRTNRSQDHLYED